MSITRQTIASAACRGVKRAFDVYEDMSDGWEWPAERGIEGFLSGYVGLAIRKDTGLSVGLEVGIKEIENLCEVTRRGPVPRRLRVQGRCDVVAFKSERPICALEVKRGFWTDKIKHDIDRLETLQRRMENAGRPMTYVGVVFPDAHWHKKAKERFDSQDHRIKQWLKENLGRLGPCHVESLLIARRTQGDEYDRFYGTAWCGIVKV